MNDDLLKEFEELLKEDDSNMGMWIFGLLLLGLFGFPVKREPTIKIYLGSDD